ncbi:glycosyltransferase family 4 protein [Paenibacillus sp. HJGM_3]|uniref:glycosyltransferase family 4 protein n=1 Tax=Paenibacillus sp. HJGM_3 TaxID=3379816 RepID=UPI00385FCC55
MKVAVISDYRINKHKDMYYVNGSATLERNFTRYLSNFDEVFYMGRIVEGDVNTFIQVNNKKIHIVENPSFHNISQYFLEYFQISKAVKKLVSEVDCCIIHFPTVQGFIAARECIKQGKPWLVELCGCPWDGFNNYGNMQGKLAAPVMYTLTHHYIKKAPYVLYVTKFFLQKKYPTKGVRGDGLSNVIIPSAEDFVLQKRLDKIKSFDLNKPIILGLIGSMKVAYKGHESAIRAIAEFKNSSYDIRLRCLGGGNEAKWKDLASKLGVLDKVEFCGVLPSGQPVLNWLDNLDLYIMPSMTEGLPRSMIEAMSRACPALGSWEGGGMSELLDSDNLFNAKNYKQLTYKIEEIIINKEKQQVCAKRNFEVAKRYSNELLSKQRNNFYDEFSKYCKKEMVNNYGT